MDWRNDAACRDEDTELFFPVGTSGPAVQQAREAKAVCHRCPVEQECRDWAIETGQQYGVFGGLTVKQRRAERRRRQGTEVTR